MIEIGPHLAEALEMLFGAAMFVAVCWAMSR